MQVHTEWKSSVFVVFIAPAAIVALLLEQERPPRYHRRIGVVDTTAREAVHDLTRPYRRRLD